MISEKNIFPNNHVDSFGGLSNPDSKIILRDSSVHEEPPLGQKESVHPKLDAAQKNHSYLEPYDLTKRRRYEKSPVAMSKGPDNKSGSIKIESGDGRSRSSHNNSYMKMQSHNTRRAEDLYHRMDVLE